MIQKKVCMLGAFAVGKTSLVRKFVTGLFSEKYQTTVGVKVDKKTLKVNDEEMTIVLWDVHGEDDYQRVRASYLRGSSGYLLVVDGTRKKTLEVVEGLQEMANEAIGPVPFIVLVNKADVMDEWELETEVFDDLAGRGWLVMKTSAKTGESVEEAFVALAQKMMTSV